MSKSDKDAVIGKNLKFLRKRRKMTQQELADALAIRRSSIGAYEECRATPKYDALINISELFGLSIDNLIKVDFSQLTIEEFENIKRGRKMDLEGGQLRVLSVTVDQDGAEHIEFVSQQKAAAGYLNGYADPEYIEVLPKFRLPTQLIGNGTYRAFEISGDSMLPLKSGTVVIGEYLQNWHKDIKNGDSYVIISNEEGVVFKRIYSMISGDGGKLSLRSDNPAYSTYEVDVKDVKEIWKAKMFLSTDFPDADISLEKLTSIVLDLQREVIQLKKP